jgi:hypothetical protein
LQGFERGIESSIWITKNLTDKLSTKNGFAKFYKLCMSNGIRAFPPAAMLVHNILRPSRED